MPAHPGLLRAPPVPSASLTYLTFTTVPRGRSAWLGQTSLPAYGSGYVKQALTQTLCDANPNPEPNLGRHRECGLIVRDRVGSGLGLGLTGVRVRWGSGSLGFGLGLTLGVEVGLVVPRHITHRP